MNPPDWIGRLKFELDTPCLVIDLDTLDSNLESMQRLAAEHGRKLRPHAKSHKCSTLARRQIERGAVGMCTAKVSEAVGLVKAGISRVLITSPLVTPTKVEAYLDCLERDAMTMVVVDGIRNLELLEAGLEQRGLYAQVLIDIDVLMGRTGCPPAQVLELAGRIAESRYCLLKGIQAYAGHVQHLESLEERTAASLEALSIAQGLFEELRAAGHPCEVFSGSGTGTWAIDLAIPDLTEFQVGSYALMDAEYLRIELSEGQTAFPPPLTLLTTVISGNREGFVTVDAGLKALYRDGAVPELKASSLGYVYDWFGDEFGKILVPQGAARPEVGSVLELIVSHCDPTVNLFDEFFVTRGDVVVEVWPIDLRGCCR